MQKVDISIFPNSAGWKVMHDPDTQMYYLENDRKRRSAVMWTSRRFAEKALFDMLVNHVMKDPRPEVRDRAKKRINKAQAA